MTWFSRHLDSATLGFAVLGDGDDPRTATHLASCARCRRERDRIALLFADARAGADAAVDAAFGPADLERHRLSVVQRFAGTGGAARVLRFPHGPDERPVATPRADARWLVAAAAAGLLLGVAAGQLPHLLSTARATPAVARTASPVAPSPAADWRLDDSLLSEVDAALASVTRPELEALDALTPVHYETR